MTRTSTWLLATLAIAGLPWALPACGGSSAADCPPQTPDTAPVTRAPAPAPEAAPAPAPSPAAARSAYESLLLATLYSNSAAEYAALTHTVYAAAQAQLDAAVRDYKWTAALEQTDKTAGKPLAVIVDVDETVLDNSPYQARVLATGKGFPEGWDEWCLEAKARAVPGAVEFAQAAKKKNVTMFFVTNRKAPLEEATRKNLKDVGFPVEEKLDVLLLRDEKPGWTSDKTSRRKLIAETHRIIMLFGDSLGDFVSGPDADGPLASRPELVTKHAAHWGKRWFALPNAMYGSWDAATFGYDFKQAEPERNQARQKALDLKQ